MTDSDVKRFKEMGFALEDENGEAVELKTEDDLRAALYQQVGAEVLDPKSIIRAYAAEGDERDGEEIFEDHMRDLLNPADRFDRLHWGAYHFGLHLDEVVLDIEGPDKTALCAELLEEADDLDHRVANDLGTQDKLRYFRKVAAFTLAGVKQNLQKSDLPHWRKVHYATQIAAELSDYLDIRPIEAENSETDSVTEYADELIRHRIEATIATQRLIQKLSEFSAAAERAQSAGLAASEVLALMVESMKWMPLNNETKADLLRQAIAPATEFLSEH